MMRLLAVVSISFVLASCYALPEIDAADRKAAMKMCLERLGREVESDLSSEGLSILRSNKHYDIMVVDVYCKEAEYENHKGYYFASGMVDYLVKPKRENGVGGGPNELKTVNLVTGITWKAE